MENYIIAAVGSVLAIVVSLITIRVYVQQLKKDSEAKVVKNALVEDHVERLQLSLDHAHDKIRNLFDKSNDVSNAITELRTTMMETNRVMRQVETALSVLAKIEERINGHIASEIER
jgi:predicted  nucleic acid-binding Zn-ribbon protein